MSLQRLNLLFYETHRDICKQFCNFVLIKYYTVKTGSLFLSLYRSDKTILLLHKFNIAHSLQLQLGFVGFPKIGKKWQT